MTPTCPMSQVTDCNMGSGHIAPVPAKAFTPEDDARLCDALKRCSPSTREAAREFRKTGSPAFVPAIVNGLIEHYVEPDARAVGDIKAFLAAKLGRVYPPGLTLTSGSPG